MKSEDHQQHGQRHDVFADKLPIFLAHRLRSSSVTCGSRRRSRRAADCCAETKVNSATGSRKSTLPAAIVVQSVKPEPSCAGMKGGAVCALRLVIINANGVLVPSGNKAEYGGCRDSCRRLGDHDFHESLQARIAVDQCRLLVFFGDLIDKALHQPNRKRQVEGCVQR